MVTVDLEYDVGDIKTGFDPIEQGQYPAKIGKCELRETQKGEPKLYMEWIITDGEHIDRKLFDHLPLINEKVRWKLKMYCVAAGIESGASLETKDFVDLEAVLQVDYNDTGGIDGGPSNNISKITPIE